MMIGEKISTAVTTERRGSVARVLINREPLNVLDLAVIDRLRETLSEVLEDSAVHLVEIHGSASAFSAGVDIRDHFPDRASAMLAAFHALLRAVLYARVPVIAVVRGFCLGGGMELALAADFVLAAEDATFGQPEIGAGCFAPAASVLLPRLIPEKKALELLLTGKPISGSEGRKVGIRQPDGASGGARGRARALRKRAVGPEPGRAGARPQSGANRRARDLRRLAARMRADLP